MLKGNEASEFTISTKRRRFPFDSATIIYFFFSSVKPLIVSGHPEFKMF